MVTTSTTLSDKERLEKVWQAFQAAQQLQEDRLAWGINHVNLYVENVDGDWLENWGEEEEEELAEKLAIRKESEFRSQESGVNN
ncbi:hypothetical protein ACP6PL_00040 [Dapis sp. BLCC M126]|uniref:hypothetical protein n=1 Tax=Dapis sp. BLCC M126 TaxID=3400189 RepID=UPI003CFA1DD0